MGIILGGRRIPFEDCSYQEHPLAGPLRHCSLRLGIPSWALKAFCGVGKHVTAHKFPQTPATLNPQPTKTEPAKQPSALNASQPPNPLPYMYMYIYIWAIYMYIYPDGFEPRAVRDGGKDDGRNRRCHALRTGGGLRQAQELRV